MATKKVKLQHALRKPPLACTLSAGKDARDKTRDRNERHALGIKVASAPVLAVRCFCALVPIRSTW